VEEHTVRDYRALHAYSGGDADSYDRVRFSALKGRLVDRLEWRLLSRGLASLSREVGSLERIIDIPCGTGRMAIRMRSPHCRVIAVDASEDMLAVARGRHAADEYVVGRVENLASLAYEADCVVSVRLLSHLPHGSKPVTFRQFRKVGGKGAVVFFASDSRWLRLRRWYQKRHGRNLEGWTPMSVAEARCMAEASGFKVIRVRGLLGPFSETHALVLVSVGRAS
jgi:ubiquinone/menaquinone biosynthesis C-methylase UbiE